MKKSWITTRRVMLGLITCLETQSVYAGLLDWLIPTAYSPDIKMGTAIDYGISGGELSAVTSDTVSNETLTKWQTVAAALPYAKLSNAVYERKESVGDWTRVSDEEKTFTKGGFHASTYQNSKTGEFVIAFQGSCGDGHGLNCVADLATDAAGLVIPTPQHVAAMEYTTKMIEKYGVNLKVTGHSLGGGLAQTVGAALGLKTVTFNPAAVANLTQKAPGAGKANNIINIVMAGDLVNPGSKLLGAHNFGETISLNFNVPSLNPLEEHSMNLMVEKIGAMQKYYSDILSKNLPLQNTSTTLLQNQLTAITQGGSSHIGSAALFTSYHTSTPSIINPVFTASLKNQTAAEQGVFANSQAYSSSAWQMVTGTVQTHFTEGSSFGPISAAGGGQITGLNNADVAYTHMTKEFQVPVGVKQVTLTLNGNFVTNEYPVYLGSQYNDYGVVKLISPSGNATQVTAFKEVLNSSNFQNVSGLPSPMMATGGQTGFKSSTATIPVANGGKVVVDVQVHNVGDTLFPSAVLLNGVQLK